MDCVWVVMQTMLTRLECCNRTQDGAGALMEKRKPERGRKGKVWKVAVRGRLF